MTVFLGGIAALLILCGSALLWLVLWQGLAESKEQFRALFEGAPIAYHEIDPDGVVRRVNRAECRLLGLDSSEILGRHIWEFVAPEERETSRIAVRQKITGQRKLVPFQRRYVRRDGAYLVLEIHENLIRDRKGRVVGIRSTLLDITERKRAEEALRLTQFTVDHSTDALFLVTPGARICYANEAASLLLGYSRDELLSMGVYDVLAGARPEQWPLRWEEIKRARSLTTEREFLRRDGSLFPAEITGNYLEFEGSEYACISLRDITERRRAQQSLGLHAQQMERKNEELSAALAAAREATELKSRFLANVSHEIRTPMNGILGMTELLLSTPLGGEQREYAQAVLDSAEALLSLINDVLDISKIEAGRMQPEFVPFDPAATVKAVAELLAVRARGKGLELTCSLDPALPSTLFGDPGRLRQVLMNLVGNAVKFTERGTVRLRAELLQDASEAVAVRFLIEDTGIGISPEQRSSLFQSFVQGDGSTTRKYGGTGLGLVISRQLVALMGGEIGFESEPGCGSTFWFVLPFQTHPGDAPSKKPQPAHTRLAPASPTDGRSRGRILLVEDNVLNQKIALRMLEKAGYIAEAVNNGAEAVEACRRMQYDLVLMDVQMPEMDGFEATAALRRLDGPARRIPIVAMTANAMAGDRERCVAAGMDDYISKPVRSDELSAVVRRWVRQPRS